MAEQTNHTYHLDNKAHHVLDKLNKGLSLRSMMDRLKYDRHMHFQCFWIDLYFFLLQLHLFLFFELYLRLNNYYSHCK